MLERDSLYSINHLQDKNDENIGLVVVYSLSNDNPLNCISWIEDSLSSVDTLETYNNFLIYNQALMLFDLFTVKGDNKGRFVMAEFSFTFSEWFGKNINTIDRNSIKVVESIKITYKNYKNKVSCREIIPIGNISFNSNEFHKTPQWLMPAYDVDKKDVRTFAFKDIISINSEDK